MTRWERYGERDLTFSAWHRTLPDRCTAIDVDFLEYCQRCRETLALIELARDVGQSHKPTTVLRHHAQRADVPAFLILYTPVTDCLIGDCRVKRIHPDPTPFHDMSEGQMRRWIVSIHDRHSCPSRNVA